jgi:hypothetical protein
VLLNSENNDDTLKGNQLPNSTRARSSVLVGEDGNAIFGTALCWYMYAFLASFALGSSITAWKTETVWVLVVELLVVKLIPFIFIPDIILLPPRIGSVDF